MGEIRLQETGHSDIDYRVDMHTNGGSGYSTSSLYFPAKAFLMHVQHCREMSSSTSYTNNIRGIDQSLQYSNPSSLTFYYGNGTSGVFSISSSDLQISLQLPSNFTDLRSDSTEVQIKWFHRNSGYYFGTSGQAKFTLYLYGVS